MRVDGAKSSQPGVASPPVLPSHTPVGATGKGGGGSPPVLPQVSVHSAGRRGLRPQAQLMRDSQSCWARDWRLPHRLLDRAIAGAERGQRRQ